MSEVITKHVINNTMLNYTAWRRIHSYDHWTIGPLKDDPAKLGMPGSQISGDLILRCGVAPASGLSLPLPEGNAGLSSPTRAAPGF